MERTHPFVKIPKGQTYKQKDRKAKEPFEKQISLGGKTKLKRLILYFEYTV